MYSDEASVSAVSALTHTYAPKGETPVVTTSTEINLRLYLASAVSPSGQMRYVVRNQPFDSKAIIAYLVYLRHAFRRKLLIVWDGASIHHSQEVKTFLGAQKQPAFHLVQQPYYSPELNADEQVWSYLKQHKLKNTCNQNLNELSQKITTVMNALKQHPKIIRNFFRHPDLGFYN